MHSEQLSEQRRHAGRIGAYVTAAKYDPREITSAARAALKQRYLDQVDPTRELPEDERERRAAAARRADLARYALKSAQNRRNRDRAAREAELWQETAQ